MITAMARCPGDHSGLGPKFRTSKSRSLMASKTCQFREFWEKIEQNSKQIKKIQKLENCSYLVKLDILRIQEKEQGNSGSVRGRYSLRKNLPRLRRTGSWTRSHKYRPRAWSRLRFGIREHHWHDHSYGLLSWWPLRSRALVLDEQVTRFNGLENMPVSRVSRENRTKF